MKILLIHNKYREVGGEDIAVANEISFLRQRHEIKTIYFENKVENFFSQVLYFFTNHNLKSIKLVKDEIVSFNPDCVYVHNTWFKANLGIFSVLLKENIQIILKIHNFRFACTDTFSASNHLKGKEFCYKCGNMNKRLGVFNKYFEN